VYRTHPPLEPARKVGLMMAAYRAATIATPPGPLKDEAAREHERLLWRLVRRELADARQRVGRLRDTA
jgi:hypothetical protein